MEPLGGNPFWIDMCQNTLFYRFRLSKNFCRFGIYFNIESYFDKTLGKLLTNQRALRGADCIDLRSHERYIPLFQLFTVLDHRVFLHKNVSFVKRKIRK